MSTLRTIELSTRFVRQDTPGEAVYELFHGDGDLLAVGVLDDANTPVGLVDRGVFTLKFGSSYGRSLYASRPISLLMDANPLVVDAGMGVAEFAQTALAQRPSDLTKGFVVVEDDAVLGVGSMLALLQAVTAESVETGHSLRQANAVLRSAQSAAQSAHTLLLDALNAMGEGVAIFDAEDRLLVWNEKYAELHRASRSVLARGVSFETLLRHGLDRGQYRSAAAQEKAWGDERLARRSRMATRASEEQELADGRCLRIEDSRLADGGCISVAVDVTEIKRREASFRLLFENNPVPLAVFDRRTLKVLAANAAARTCYGYEGETLDALFAHHLLSPEERRAAMRVRLGRSDAAHDGLETWTLVTATGERLQVRLYMHPLTHEGRPATLAAMVDVSTQHRAESALMAALKAAEEADRAKSEFLANTSHELRTPLNGIVGMASVLARTPLSEAQAEMVEVIRTSSSSLKTLLSDVLDLAKIEAGQLDLQNEPVVPASLARHVARLFDEPCALKGLEFELDLDPGAQAAVLADSVRLTQILTNLCSNAVKFTEAGRVRLSVRSLDEGDGMRRLAFAVADTGIGMGPDAQARVFERFAQADGSITRRFGGTGLGLAISRHLVELMGSRISLSSAPGRGSTFYLDVSVPVAPQLALVASQPCLVPSPSHAAGRREVEDARLRVLLVEDHPVNRRVVNLILSAAADLVEVENGEQAVAAAREGDYDVILMDMQMPVMDGVTATQVIREEEARLRRPRTPIIMLTANALAEHIETSRLAGSDAHLAKPITAQALLSAIHETLHPAQRATA